MQVKLFLGFKGSELHMLLPLLCCTPCWLLAELTGFMNVKMETEAQHFHLSFSSFEKILSFQKPFTGQK